MFREPIRPTVSLTLSSFLAPLKIEDALILYMAAPSNERQQMARFYTRHSSYLSHLHEYVRLLICPSIVL